MWNRPTTLGNPPEIHLVVLDGNQAQSSTPHGMTQSERAPSGNNLTSAGNHSGMNLSNGSPMLGNPTSTKKPKTAKKGHNQTTTMYSHEQECFYRSSTNNNTAQGRLWNRSTTSSTPLGIHLIVVDGSRAQSGPPNGMS